jgi:hypothetical protein
VELEGEVKFKKSEDTGPENSALFQNLFPTVAGMIG